MKEAPTLLGLLERANLNHNPVTEVSGSLMLILAWILTITLFIIIIFTSYVQIINNVHNFPFIVYLSVFKMSQPLKQKYKVPANKL